KEERCDVEANDERQSKNAVQGGECAELAFVDLIAETHMLRPVEHIFRQEVDEHPLLRSRVLYGVHGTDKTVLQSGILLLDKPGKLRIRGHTTQGQDQRFDHRRNDSGK